MLRAAHEAGVKVPEPIAYLGEVDGKEAFVMERVRGETIGRRIVKSPPPELDVQLAEELAKIHAIPPGRLPFLEQGDAIARFYDELDSVGEPHPAIELGLHWVRERLPPPSAKAGVSRSSCTATGGSATSRSTSTGSSRCSTGSSRTSATRSRISPGRSCARGASAPTTCTSAASASSSRISSATRS